MDNLKLAVVWDVFFAPQHHSTSRTVDFVHKQAVVSTTISTAAFALSATPLLKSLNLPVMTPLSTWITSREPQHQDHAAAWAHFENCFLERHDIQVTPWKHITTFTIECMQETTQSTFTCTAIFDEKLQPTTLDPLEAWKCSHFPAHANAL